MRLGTLATCVTLTVLGASLLGTGDTGPERIRVKDGWKDTYEISYELRIVDDPAEMRRIYYAANNHSNLRMGQTVKGFAGVTNNGKQVVYILRPKDVDDDNVLTLGHETLHLFLGDYHKDNTK